jgi:hypothetical protein
MTPENFETYVLLGAQALGLTLSEESREAVIANLRLLHDQAAEFVDLALPDEIDSAGVMRL